MESIFAFKDYHSYLKELLKHRLGGRGAKSQLARVIGCHSAYVSFLLQGKAELSPEQAQKINEYLKHNQDESQYFHLLVQRARAGYSGLSQFLDSQISELRQRNLESGKRIEFDSALSEKDQVLFYSRWIFSAVHLAVAVREINSVAQLAKRFKLSVEETQRILFQLEHLGLVEQKNGSYKRTVRSTHLGKDSAMLLKHLSNWRIKSIEASERLDHEDLFFSSTFTCSHSDREKVREKFLQCIQEIRKMIKDSPDEEVFAYNIDLFKV